MFNIKQKELDQVKKKEKLKSTNPLKVNKRKRKQKDIIMRLIDNLPNHLKDIQCYLLNLKNSIDIPIACIKCRKYGHYGIMVPNYTIGSWALTESMSSSGTTEW